MDNDCKDIFNKKLRLDKDWMSFIFLKKSIPNTDTSQPYVIQVITEFREKKIIRIENFKKLITKIPIENRHVLEDNIVYLNWIGIQPRNKNISIISLYQDEIDHTGNITMVNFYLDDWAVRLLKAREYTEGQVREMLFNWVQRNKMFKQQGS